MSRVLLVFVDGLGSATPSPPSSPPGAGTPAPGNFLPGGGPPGGRRPSAELPRSCATIRSPRTGSCAPPTLARPPRTAPERDRPDHAPDRRQRGAGHQPASLRVPHPSLQAILLTGSIFKRLAEAAGRPCSRTRSGPLLRARRPGVAAADERDHVANRAGGSPSAAWTTWPRIAPSTTTSRTRASPHGVRRPPRLPERAGAISPPSPATTTSPCSSSSRPTRRSSSGRGQGALRAAEARVFLAALLLTLDLGRPRSS